MPNCTRAVQKKACADENRPADIVHTYAICIRDSYKHEGCMHDFHILKMEAVGFSEMWQLAARLRGVTYRVTVLHVVLHTQLCIEADMYRLCDVQGYS